MTCTGTTGHAESIEVEYDSAKVGYEELVRFFFEMHDPTQVNRQGNDVGSQYRSVVFYHGEAQRAAAAAMLASLGSSGRYRRPLATELVEAMPFYPAEDYHQDYLRKNPGGYCHGVSRECTCLIYRAGRRDVIHDFGAATIGRQGQAAAHDLTEAGQIRANAIKRLRASIGDAKAGHHLVENEQRAVLRGDSAQFLQEAGFRQDEARIGRIRLDDHTGDLVAFFLKQLLQGRFVRGRIVKAPLGVLILPVIQQPRRDLVTAHQLRRRTDPAQVLFNHLALELVAERSSVFHGKILSPLLGDLGSCPVL